MALNPFSAFAFAFASLLPPAYVVQGKVLFSQVSVCPHLGGVPTFKVGGGSYPGWGGTYPGEGVPTLVRGVPTLVRGYLPWWGVPTLVRGGYLP